MPRRRTEEETAYVQSSVLSASAKLYLEKGFSHTTVRDISAVSGITVNHIMKMMKSKEAIQFVSQFDYPKLAQSTIETMLERLEQTINTG